MDKYENIKALFEENADFEKAASMAEYMRNMFDFYGISSPKRKELTKEFIKEEKKNRIVDWEFLDKCYEDEHREFQYVVNDYISAMAKYLEYDDIKKLWKYIKVKQWWDTIDFFDKVIGSIGLRDKRVDKLMLEWSVDEDFWVRRIAIDHQLGRKEKTNEELLERIIINNLGSKEFFINKAIGWALRDYSKVNPKWVGEFTEKYREKMDRVSLKEAEKYI